MGLGVAGVVVNVGYKEGNTVWARASGQDASRHVEGMATAINECWIESGGLGK
jgi:hypothetical protein